MTHLPNEDWRARAQQRWPSLDFDDEAVRASEAWPRESRFGDEVLLVVLALRADRGALRVLEASYFSALEAMLTQRFDATLAADATQELRSRLLLGEARLRDWRGADGLEKWLRLCGLREAQRLARSASSLPPSPTPTPGGDPSLVARHREVLEEVLARATATLEPAHRSILKLHLFENVSVESIAQLHGVSRATMTRWLRVAREALQGAVVSEGKRALGVGESTFESLGRALVSDLDVSLERLLEPEPRP